MHHDSEPARLAGPPRCRPPLCQRSGLCSRLWNTDIATQHVPYGTSVLSTPAWQPSCIVRPVPQLHLPQQAYLQQRAAACRRQQQNCGRRRPPVRYCKAARRTCAASGHQQRDHERGGAVAGGARAARPVRVDGAARAHGPERGPELRGARQRQRGQIGDVRAAAGVAKHVVARACSERRGESRRVCLQCVPAMTRGVSHVCAGCQPAGRRGPRRAQQERLWGV